MKQLTHEHIPFNDRKFPIVLVLDSIASPANVGSIFRLADAFNVEKVILCGHTFSDLSNNRLKRTARSTLHVMDYHIEDNTTICCQNLSSQGYTVLALEITTDSKPINSLLYTGYPKVALVIGNERAGISEEILQLATDRIHIEMFGKNSSLNVAHATGIALFEITKSLQPV